MREHPSDQGAAERTAGRSRASLSSLLDVATAADYLGLSRERVYRLARSGDIPHTKAGRNLRFGRADLDRFLDARAVRSNRTSPPADGLLARAFLSSPQPMSISTLKGRRFISVNDSLLELSGYRREEIIGRTSFELDIYAEPRDAARVGSLLEKHGKIRNLEVSFRVKDSNACVGLLSAEVIEYGGEKCVLAAISECTERKQMDAVLRRRAEELAEANRFKDEFLARLSCELRTPLNLMLGWSRLLGSGRLDEATTARGLETIGRNAKLQAQLIDDLLDISRILTGTMCLKVGPVDLASVIEAALNSVRPSAEAKFIRIEFRNDAPVATLSGDALRLQQVVRTLLSNAVKSTPSKGRIGIQLRCTDDGQLRLAVSDAGPGIRPELLPHVFDILRDSAANQPGGLDLRFAILQHLVQMHGGTVRAESAGEGRGATFIVALPATGVLPQL